MGWALDAFDFNTLPLALTAIGAQFALSPSKSGLIMTVTLVASAVGGSLAGLLADRISRTRVLMITIGTFAVFTALSGLSQNYTEILLFKGIQGLGFGGEWSVGAVLIAEVAPARFRGRLLGYVSTSWAVGWALAIVAYTLIFSYAGHDARRYLFFVGILPAVALLFMRRNVQDSEVSVKSREEAAVQKSAGSGFSALFRTDRRRDQQLPGGRDRGQLPRLRRRRAPARPDRPPSDVHHLPVTGVVCVLAYTQIPAQANALLLVLGLPLAWRRPVPWPATASSSASCSPAGCEARASASRTTSAAAWLPSSRSSSARCPPSSASGRPSASAPSDTSSWSSAPWRSPRLEAARSRNDQAGVRSDRRIDWAPSLEQQVRPCVGVLAHRRLKPPTRQKAVKLASRKAGAAGWEPRLVLADQPGPLLISP